MSDEGMPLAGLRVGIFGKGGSGKSTATALLADALCIRGYSVLVLDADSTNMGLAAALGVDRDPDPLLDYFGGMVFSGGLVTCPVDDPTPLAGAAVSLRDLPDRFIGRRKGLHLLVAGKIGALGPGAGCDGPIAKIARDVVVRDLGPDHVVLVDFKAGFEDSARGVLTSLDWAVVVVDPTVAAVRMAAHLANMVRDLRAGAQPATQHLERADLIELAIRQFREARVRGVIAVLNRVKDDATEAYLRKALAEADVPVGGGFGRDSAVEEQWLRGQSVRSEVLSPQAEAIVDDIEFVNRAGAVSMV